MGIMSKYKISISLEFPSIPLFRERERLVISTMMETRLIQKNQWPAINRCKIYLRIITLADVASEDGRQISINSWEGVIMGKQYKQY